MVYGNEGEVLWYIVASIVQSCIVLPVAWFVLFAAGRAYDRMGGEEPVEPKDDALAALVVSGLTAVIIGFGHLLPLPWGAPVSFGPAIEFSYLRLLAVIVYFGLTARAFQLRSDFYWFFLFHGAIWLLVWCGLWAVMNATGLTDMPNVPFTSFPDAPVEDLSNALSDRAAG